MQLLPIIARNNIFFLKMSAKRFQNKMALHLDEYQIYLLGKSSGTAVSHCSIINEFINYLYNQHLIVDVSQITVSIANSKFLADFKRKNKEIISKETMKEILKGFFTFIYEKYGVQNDTLMRGLEK
jgi:hypothetical protein